MTDRRGYAHCGCSITKLCDIHQRLQDLAEQLIRRGCEAVKADRDRTARLNAAADEALKNTARLQDQRVRRALRDLIVGVTPAAYIARIRAGRD